MDGDPAQQKWVVYGGKGDYQFGGFDGKTFRPETELLPYNYGNCFYASQTFNDIPKEDGRRIQIAWGRAGHESMPFNQMMNFPVELTLRTTPEGPRLFAWPVREIEALYQSPAEAQNLTLNDESKIIGQGDCFDIEARISVADAKKVGFTIRGVEVAYDVATQTLTCGGKKAPVALVDGALSLRLLVDRLSTEIFANQGQIYMPMACGYAEDNQEIAVFAQGGKAECNNLYARPLKSAWR